MLARLVDSLEATWLVKDLSGDFVRSNAARTRNGIAERGSYRKWDASSDSSVVLGKCCGSEEKLYSINTPLTTSNFKIRASPALQRTPINTVDVYVFYF
jgi:hypothetical protein